MRIPLYVSGSIELHDLYLLFSKFFFKIKLLHKFKIFLHYDLKLFFLHKYLEALMVFIALIAGETKKSAGGIE